MSPKWCALFILLCGFATRGACAEEPGRLVVRDIRILSSDPGKLRLLTSFLVYDLASTGRFHIIPHSEIERLHEKGELPEDECDRLTCILDFGEVLGANWVLDGQVGETEGTYDISLSLYNVEAGRKEMSGTWKCYCTAQELVERVAVYAMELFGTSTESSSCVTGECHALMVKQINSSLSVHEPVQRGRCLACHVSHDTKTNRRNFLLKVFYPDKYDLPFADDNYLLCWGCHADHMALSRDDKAVTSFRDGEINLHYTHVNSEKGKSCRSCHRAHYAGQDKLMRDDVPFRMGAWKLPIKFTLLPDGGSCVVGCHRQQTYHND